MYLPKARLHTTTPTQNNMATNNHRIEDDNNSSSQGRLSEPVQRLIKCLISERPKRPYTTCMQRFEDDHIEMIKLLCGLNDITVKEMEDNQRINSAKFDKMIALLEKIAGERE